MLYIVATPIGNLDDISKRAILVLSSVDLILCEDTRVSRILLDHYQIKKELISYHKFNEQVQTEKYIKLLKDNRDVALISDAGTPLISDPGFFLVKCAIDNNLKITVIPGASAFISALLLSGISPSRFLFYGFLPKQTGKLKKELTMLKAFPYTMIFYESSLQLLTTLQMMKEIFKTREISVSREITKLFEETIRFNVDELNSVNIILKGEFVIVVKGSENIEVDEEKLYHEYLSLGFDEMSAIKRVSKITKKPRTEIYKKMKGIKNE